MQLRHWDGGGEARGQSVQLLELWRSVLPAVRAPMGRRPFWDYLRWAGREAEEGQARKGTVRTIFVAEFLQFFWQKKVFCCDFSIRVSWKRTLVQGSKPLLGFDGWINMFCSISERKSSMRRWSESVRVADSHSWRTKDATKWHAGG